MISKICQRGAFCCCPTSKTPVNFDLEGCSATFQSVIDRSGTLHAISSEPVIKHLEDFAWPRDPWRLEVLSQWRSKVVN